MQKIFIDFRPAELKDGKETYITYYAKNPVTETLVRQKVRLNHIKNKAERLKYGRKLCYEINLKLHDGWSPYFEKLNTNKLKKITEATQQFLKEKERNIRADSLRCYKSFVKIFLEYLKMNKLEDTYIVMYKKIDADYYLKYVYDKVKVNNRTHNAYLVFMNTLWIWFIDKEYTKENPFAKIKRKKVDQKHRQIIPKEIREVIKKYLLNENMFEYYILCQLTYRLCLRPKESLNLKIKNIDFKNKMLRVPSEVAKNHNERILAITDDIMNYFETIKHENENFYIFSDNYKPGKVLKDTRDSSRTWSKMRVALNLPSEYQFYSLKDTCITEMLEAGVPAKIVKELADHHSIEMTEKYLSKSKASEILRYNNLEF